MSKLKIPLNVLTGIQQMVRYLYRLTAACLNIRRLQRKDNDYSLDMKKAVHVRFMNRGQTAVLIDQQITLLPGEAYSEGDTAGPGLDHVYEIIFVEDLPKSSNVPEVDRPFVFPGNYLDIRYLERIYYDA